MPEIKLPEGFKSLDKRMKDAFNDPKISVGSAKDLRVSDNDGSLKLEFNIGDTSHSINITPDEKATVEEEIATVQTFQELMIRGC